MIEVELPDGTIVEFPDGTSRGVMQKALQGRFPQSSVPKVGDTEDALRSFANGIARGTPKALDFASSALASAFDNTVGRGGDYFDENLTPRTPVFNKAADAVFGKEYQPQQFTGKAAQFGGELVSPAGVAKGVKNGFGFLTGLFREGAPFIRDSSQLLNKFKDWKSAIEATPITGSQIAEDIAGPFNKATKFVQPYADAASTGKVHQLNDLAKAGKTNLGYVYGLRKTLGNIDSSIAQPMREAIDSGLSKYASRDGLDDYRRFKVAENVDDALRNYGNETVKATRTKLNNLDKKGMTSFERDALRNAGRGTLTEGAFRLGARGTNAITSAMTGIASGNASLGLGMYGAGRGLEKIADIMAARRIEALRGAILNGRDAPSIGERFGTFVRGKIKK